MNERERAPTGRSLRADPGEAPRCQAGPPHPALRPAPRSARPAAPVHALHRAWPSAHPSLPPQGAPQPERRPRSLTGCRLQPCVCRVIRWRPRSPAVTACCPGRRPAPTRRPPRLVLRSPRSGAASFLPSLLSSLALRSLSLKEIKTQAPKPPARVSRGRRGAPGAPAGLA